MMKEKEKMVLDKGENQIDVENNQVDEALVQKLDELVKIKDEIDKINELAVNKVLEIEHANNEELKPLYNTRNEFVKNNADFWRTVFLSHPVLRPLLNLKDHKIFQYFNSLEVKDVKSGYSIIFNFDPNPYFKNASLEKTFIFLDDGTTVITATPIEWEVDFVNMTLTAEELRLWVVQISIEPKESFFAWFSRPEQIERTEDFEDKIADTIKLDLWPNLLSHLKIKPDGDEADDEKVTKKSEVENDQLQDASIHSYEMVLKNQDYIDKINEKAMVKVFEVENWHNKECKLAYDKRNEIIKTIPDFWRIAFLSHPVLTTYIKAVDEEILKHITSLEVEGHKAVNPGYSITFNFGHNDYFENTLLKKTYKFLDEGIEITATPIKWKEGKAQFVDYKKRYNMRPLSDESFFAWFSPQEPKMWEPLKDVIADIIKEDLWLNPLSYFHTEPGGDEADDWMDVCSDTLSSAEKNRKRSRIEDNYC